MIECLTKVAAVKLFLHTFLPVIFMIAFFGLKGSGNPENTKIDSGLRTAGMTDKEDL